MLKHGLDDELRQELNRIIQNNVKKIASLDKIGKLADFAQEIDRSTESAQKKLANLDHVLRILDAIDYDTTRSQLLTSFFPENLFICGPIKPTLEAILQTLENDGPFYIGGELSRSQSAPSMNSIVNVTSLVSGSAHAVLVAGADEKKKLVYYIDPNKSNEVKSIAPDVLIPKVSRYDRKANDDIEVITLNCPERTYGKDYECSHLGKQGALP